MKYTDDEIIKEATEAYNQNLGAGCYVGDLLGIISRQNAEIERLQKDLDIINAANTELYGAFEENERLKSEIERLQKECEITRAYIHNNGLEWGLVSHLEFCKNQRAEARKEFAERLKKNTVTVKIGEQTCKVITVEGIDNLFLDFTKMAGGD